jgi:penicillin-binding protein 2
VTDRSRLRIVVLRVVVVSILLTLLGRLAYLQVAEGSSYRTAASQNRVRDIVTTATRGQILDDQGVALVTNRIALVVSVNRAIVLRTKHKGADELARLSRVIGLSVTDINRQITPCVYTLPNGKRVKAIDGCWKGSPYQPVPIKSYNSENIVEVHRVLMIAEHQELFPGVTAQYEAVREYPFKTLAAHALGYLGPITADDIKAHPEYKDLAPGSQLGRTGVEAVYDEQLRGQDGIQQLRVDKDGNPVGTQGETPAVAGDNLVLSIDSGVQQAAEKALAEGIKQARTRYDKSRKRNYTAPGGTAITVEVNTGRVVAMASYPTYDPTAFVGGISNAAYQALLHGVGHPLTSNAVQGTYSPGSTFKIVSTSAAVKAGYSLTNRVYPCPGIYKGKHNFEGESFATLDFRETLIRSCDTVYYKLAFEQWLADGGRANTGHAKEYFSNEAKTWGFGRKTGIDLPDERVGLITNRAYKIAFWKKNKSEYCKGAKRRPKGTYLQQLDDEFCQDGWALNGGDAMNFAIGQGDVLVTPLQLVMAYSALVNGGVLYQPQLAKGFVSVDGTTTTLLPPKVTGHVDTPTNVRDYIRNALAGVTKPPGTAKGSFAGFPFSTVDIGGKTGTADVNGKAPTSWFASFAPASHPRYATVVMVAEAGTGGTTAAPIARKIWDAIYGVEGAKSDLKAGALPRGLPVVRNDGTIGPPGTRVTRVTPTPTGTQSLGLPWGEEARRTRWGAS